MLLKEKIKAMLVPITIYWLMNLGFFMAWPYISLQARSYGLTMSEILLVAGLVPFITFPGAPILGYAADKLGYKFILLLSMIMTGCLSFAYCYIPGYTEAPKYWVKIESPDDFNISSSNPIKQFGSYTTSDSCEETINVSISSIVCNDVIYNINFDLVVNQFNYINSSFCEPYNCNYCLYDISNQGENVTFCEAKLEGVENTQESGNQKRVFWFYVAFRIVWEFSINPAWNTADALASRIAQKVKIDWAAIIFFGQISSIISPLLAGYLLDRFTSSGDILDCISGQPTDLVKSYSIAFYLMFGIYIGSAIIIFFLKFDIEAEKKSGSFFKDLSWLPKLAPMSFYLFLLISGIIYSVYDGFYFVFIVEVLNISDKWFGILNALNGLVGVVQIALGGILHKYVGSMNIVVCSLLFTSIRILLVSQVRVYDPEEVPTEVLLCTLLECLVFQWIGVIGYVKLVAPRELTATGMGLASSCMFVLARGIGSFTSGQINEIIGMRNLFEYTGYTGIGCAVVFGLAYHAFIKRTEIKIEKEEKSSSSDPDKEDDILDGIENLGFTHL